MRAAAILTLATLLVPVVAQCQDTHEVSRKASVIDNEVWLDSVTGPPQLTQDSVPKWFALLALDGKRIAYLEEEFSSHVQQNQSPQVIMVDDNGKELWRVTPGGSWPGDRFDMLEWIDDQRIGTMHCGHLFFPWKPLSGQNHQFDFRSSISTCARTNSTAMAPR
jgi:hypothetical protein